MKKSIIFLGAKPIGYRCLCHLLNAREANVKAIVTRPAEKEVWWNEEQRVYKLAEKYSIPLISSSDILNYNIDFIFSIQHNEILPEEILEHPSDLSVNLHMAPLPEYRGCNQFSFAIINEEDEFGTTLHIMTEDIDGGDVIAEERFSISDGITVRELYELTEEYSINLFRDTLHDILNMNIQPVSQEMLSETRDENYYSRNKINEVKKLDPEWSPSKIQKYVRALDFPPFEPPYFKIKGKKIYLSFTSRKN